MTVCQVDDMWITILSHMIHSHALKNKDELSPKLRSGKRSAIKLSQEERHAVAKKAAARRWE